MIAALREEGLWPAVVPSAVLIECLTGEDSRDATANRLLKTCDVVEELPDELARHAARLYEGRLLDGERPAARQLPHASLIRRSAGAGEGDSLGSSWRPSQK